MENDKVILDVCCGPRMFWFDKHHPAAVYMDIRKEEFLACDGRRIKVHPDLLGDFRNIPFPSGSFRLVVFDPPHDNYAGTNSFTAQKYGKLSHSWKEDLRQGFEECMRVLAEYGVLIFKWNELRIPVSQIIEAIGEEPLFGHKSGKQQNTHWLCFMKFPVDELL